MGLIADIFEVQLLDKITNEVIATTTLQDANIDVKVNETEVRAGQGNPLIGVLHSNRDITISLTDAKFRYDWLSRQLGQDVKTGAGVAYAKQKFVTVDTGTTITLDKAPVNNEVYLYTMDNQKITGFTTTTTSVDLTAATPTVAVGDQVEVRTYAYASDPETQTIEFDNKVFAKGVMAVLTTYEIAGDETIEKVLQYQFDNTAPDGNFQIQTKSERSAVTQAFGLKVLKPDNTTVVGRLLRMPYVEGA